MLDDPGVYLGVLNPDAIVTRRLKFWGNREYPTLTDSYFATVTGDSKEVVNPHLWAI